MANMQGSRRVRVHPHPRPFPPAPAAPVIPRAARVRRVRVREGYGCICPNPQAAPPEAQKARPKRPAQFPGRGPEAPGRGPAQFSGPLWAGPRPGPVSSRPAQFLGLRPRAQGPPPPPPTCGAARAAAALQIQAGCLGEIVRQTKSSVLCPRIWLQEPTPKSTVWRGSQNSEWGSAAEVCFSGELQQLENPTLAFFKAEKPSLDVRTKFGGIDAKKIIQKLGSLGGL